MPIGYVSIAGGYTSDGGWISVKDAIDRGFLSAPDCSQPSWLPRHELAIGGNCFTNLGNKYLAYLFGGRTPVSNYICTSFGVGTDDTAATVADTSLLLQVDLGSSSTKAIDNVTYPEDYIALVQFTIGAAEANGYLLREYGLYSGDGTLLARKTGYNINKTSQYSPVLYWRIS